MDPMIQFDILIGIASDACLLIMWLISQKGLEYFEGVFPIGPASSDLYVTVKTIFSNGFLIIILVTILKEIHSALQIVFN